MAYYPAAAAVSSVAYRESDDGVYFDPDIFIDPTDKPVDLRCVICLNVCQNAVETNCHHLFCHHCFQQLSTANHYGTYQCSICRRDRPTFYEAGTIRRLVDDLRVRCLHATKPVGRPSSSGAPTASSLLAASSSLSMRQPGAPSSSSSSIDGCSWTGRRGDLVTHLRACLYVPLPCGFQCGTTVRRSSLDSHMTTTCTRRPIICDFCNHSIPLNTIASHQLKCKPGPCPHGCGTLDILPRLMALHEDTCGYMEAPCPFQQFGCQQLLQRKDLLLHVNGPKGMQAHMKTVMRSMIKDEMKDELKQMNDQWQREREHAAQREQVLIDRLVQLETRLAHLTTPSQSPPSVSSIAGMRDNSSSSSSNGLQSSFSMSSIDNKDGSNSNSSGGGRATSGSVSGKKIGPQMPSGMHPSAGVHVYVPGAGMVPSASSSSSAATQSFAYGGSGNTTPMTRSASTSVGGGGTGGSSLPTTIAAPSASNNSRSGFFSSIGGALFGRDSSHSSNRSSGGSDNNGGALTTTADNYAAAPAGGNYSSSNSHGAPVYHTNNYSNVYYSTPSPRFVAAAPPPPPPAPIPAPTTQPTLLAVKGTFDDTIITAVSHIMRSCNTRMPPHTLLSDNIPAKIEETLPSYASVAPAAILFWKHVGTRCMADNIGSFVSKLGSGPATRKTAVVILFSVNYPSTAGSVMEVDGPVANAGLVTSIELDARSGSVRDTMENTASFERLVRFFG